MCSQNTAFSLHKNYDLVNCLLQIPDMSIIHKLKEEMGGDALLEFVSPEFGARAEDAYESLAISKLTFENVWEVFQALLPLVFPPDCELDKLPCRCFNSLSYPSRMDVLFLILLIAVQVSPWLRSSEKRSSPVWFSAFFG